MKLIQTFLERFNCIPFEEKPQVLFQTWETFFAIQCSQPEDSNELFQKLLNDLKELAEYDQSTRTDRPIFLNDNEDHSVQNRESPKNSSEENVVSKTNQEPPQDSDIHQLIDECCEEVHEEQKKNMEKTMLDLVKICHHKQYLCIHDDVDDLIKSALDSKLFSINSINSQRLDKKEQEVKNVEEQPAELAPILSTKEPENSLSMGYEHLSINPETESDEVTKSNAKNLLPIPSECEYVEASLLDLEIVSIKEENGVEEENVVQREEEENDNSNNSSNDPLLEEVDLFLSDDLIPPGIENIADDPEGDIRFLEELLIDDSILSHESFDSSFEDNLSISRPPPEPPDVETDVGEEIPWYLVGMELSHDFICHPNLVKAQ
nr:hypothetical protein [Tanacetum cinerariifolium]